MSDPFTSVMDETDDDVQVSENVATDFLEYFRSEVVGHEQEGWLMFLGLVSGYGYGDSFHINVLGKGEPGSGKSLTKNTVETLIPETDKYTKTDASSNAILDSIEWDVALVAPLDEYDKIDKAIVEVLKSSNPEDGGYAKDRNVEDPDAAGGYSPTEVSAEQNPWVVLYAPSSKKGGVNDELADRSLILYFSNNRHTRRAIGRKEFGHDEIDSSKYDNQYIYDAHDTSLALRSHIRGLDIEETYETDDDGEVQLVSRTGATAAYIPRWVWYAIEPIFSIDDDHTNRVYGIVANLMKASAIANHHSRPTREVEVYVDEDSTATETKQQYVVQPQDVANVIMCLESLLSTTHQLTPLKRHILDAVEQTEPMTADDGTTVTKVQEWLDNNDIPHPSRSTLKDRMDELAEAYYLQRWKSTAGPKGQADAYQLHDDGALQPPRSENLRQHAERDGVNIDEPCIECDPDDPFADAHDPLRDQPITETIAEFAEQFSSSRDTGDDTVSALEDAMYGGSDSADNDADATPSDASLDSFDDSDGGTDETETTTAQTTATPSLDADGEPETAVEAWVYENVTEGVFGVHDSVPHYVDAVSTGASVETTPTDDTVLDPDHELWNYPEIADDRVITVEDAQRELREAFDALRGKNLVAIDETNAPPAMEQLLVAET